MYSISNKNMKNTETKQAAEEGTIKTTLNLLDLIDKKTLDEILDAFNEVCGIGSVIADTEGRPLSGEQNFTKFCARYCRGTAEGRKRCYASDAFGGEMSLKQQEPYVYNCLNAGLVDCATPIIVEGYHLANLNGGQVLEEPIPDDVAIARARAIGIEDIDGYLRALRSIPFITKPKLQKIVKFMAVITRTLSDMAMQKYLLAKQSKEYLNKLVNSASDCIFAMDPNFRITMVNKVCHEVFSCEDGQLYGRNFADLLAPPDKILECKGKLDEGVEENFRVEMEGIDAAGSKFPAQVSISRINDEDGAVAGYVVILRDITEEKRHEKMKQDLVAMLSHDMRNPISAINKTLELLSTRRIGLINEKQEHIIRLASNTNDQLGSMVNSFLDIFRDENTNFQLNKTRFDINQVVGNCIEELSLLFADKNLAVRPKSRHGVLTIEGDLVRIKRTMTNLLSNAINYSVTNGMISVETQRVLGRNRLLMKTARSHLASRIEPGRKYLWVTVKDQGYGVPEEYQEAIFEKFFTVESKEGLGRRGIGLGLAFCKLVVEAHGGIIFARTPSRKLKNRNPPGCEFHFILPVA
jgi:PAS domain S-box-containing protein